MSNESSTPSIPWFEEDIVESEMLVLDESYENLFDFECFSESDALSDLLDDLNTDFLLQEHDCGHSQCQQLKMPSMEEQIPLAVAPVTQIRVNQKNPNLVVSKRSVASNADEHYEINVEGSSTPSLKRKRQSWTVLEKSCLVGIIFDLFLFVGTLSFSRLDCPISWDHIALLLSKALNENHQRTAETVQRAFKTIKSDAKRKILSLYALHMKWKLEINTNERLLSTAEYLKVVVQARGSSMSSVVADGDRSIRRNSWNRVQEVILIGVITEYIHHHGSLKTQTRSDTSWTSISTNYNAMCAFHSSRLPSLTEGRTKNALKRHFKEMRQKLSRGALNAMHFINCYKDFADLYTPRDLLLDFNVD